MDKIKSYVEKSLSRKFGVIMGSFVAFFVVGTAILLAILQVLGSDYTDERTALKEKEKAAEKIEAAFNESFFDARGYLAFENPYFRENAKEKEEDIGELTRKFERLVSSEKDVVALQNIREFSDYYFNRILPPVFAEFNRGATGRELEAANSGSMKRVAEFKRFMNTYILGLDKDLDRRYLQLRKAESLVMAIFTAFIFGILLVIFVIARIMIFQVGKPLAEFAAAAESIADGRHASILIGLYRKDEIGTLSAAFRKMVAKVMEKEQDLLSRNQMLEAQTKELHEKQQALEETLEIVRTNEETLSSRNHLINRMSTSLNKREVLGSVVSTMRITLKADRGIIVFIPDETAVSEGLSTEAELQFIRHLNAGFLSRMNAEKGPIVIERKTIKDEIGFHEGDFFCEDLYLPVLSADKEITAVMCFTKYGSRFNEGAYDDWRSLAKNIGIALDKIALYEQSEKERTLNKSILDTVNEGIQLVDKKGAILQVNNQFCGMFCMEDGNPYGIGKDEWAGMMSSFIVEREEFSTYLAAAIESNAKPGSFTYTKKDGGQVIKVYSEAVSEGEERLGTVFVHRDITKEFEVDQMKSEFVSTVSHELRTPLASILGFSELMLTRELKPDRQKKYVSTILNEAKRLTSLINDFLDVQKMESGKMTYSKQPADALQILGQVLDLYKAISAKHELVLETDMEQAVFLGDRDKMEQVFRNLISNAVKYSPEGGLIKVSVGKIGSRIKVDIADEGIGIPAEAIGKLFTKFYRVDNSDLRKIGGTGLGLAIVQEIVKAHGGTVSVSSIEGKGSVFSIVLPEFAPHTDTALPIVEQETGYKVMVVEDDPSLGQLISQELRDSGFRVVYFAKGSLALEYMRNTPPDTVVLDIILEGEQLDGWEIMREMKQDPVLKDIPIIISSAIDEKMRGMKLGAQEFLVKPYKPSQLSKTIMQTLLRLGKTGQIFVPGTNGENDGE